MKKAPAAGPVETGAARMRKAIRTGRFDRVTFGRAPGFVQANLVILPADWAGDFLRYCHANPEACPLLCVSEPGSSRLPALGSDIDVRCDVPRYRVFEDGVEIAKADRLDEWWRDDLVTFALGCSFSFEEALLEAGLPIRHLELGSDQPVPCYITNVATQPAGRFEGPLVVTMRPFLPAQAIRAIQICSRFPKVHGAPMHFGDPERIGIVNFDRPEWGSVPILYDGEVPLFWPCGVTPQVAIERARPPYCITHEPGYMLITDLRNSALASF
ncbi:MAG: putative hydro-lyase [Alphaproteobacteria bacterium]|nr:putative hydro-lyase [Alphaproteobacteria bacterium]